MSISGIVSSLCLLGAAALAVLGLNERQERVNLEQANLALRQQLSRMPEVTADNQRLLQLAAQMKASPSTPRQPREEPSVTDEQYRELLRLRGEVGVLLRQSNEVASLGEDTRRMHAAAASRPQGQNAGGTAGAGSQLEIVSANYWTANTNLDVAEELRERIRGDSLKAVASNNIKDDPDYGQVKHLTVVYRFGGVLQTNEFREGDVVILPPE